MTVQMDNFAPEVIERLKWYVYRLVDPRSGETFYIGKGKGNRVFQHAKGALSASDDRPWTQSRSLSVHSGSSGEARDPELPIKYRET